MDIKIDFTMQGISEYNVLSNFKKGIKNVEKTGKMVWIEKQDGICFGYPIEFIDRVEVVL